MPNRLRSATLVMSIVCLVGTISGRAVSAQDLAALQARADINAQLAQYSYRWDSKDAVGFAALFTEDAVMERRRHGTLVPGSRVVGRQAILDYARGSHQGRLADRQTRHHMSGLVFLELTPERAVTENMALITHQRAEDRAPFISSSGIYRNTWRKADTGWRIAERVLFSDRGPITPAPSRR